MPSWVGVTTSVSAAAAGSNGARAAEAEIRFGLLQMSIGAAPSAEKEPPKP
jgi:hypothetical protein